MRKWILAVCCSVLLLGGCSDPAVSQEVPDQETQDNMEQSGNESKEQAPGLLSNGEVDIDPLAAGRTITEPSGPDLTAMVLVQQSDGLAAEAPGNLILNEAIGYYMYILPGFRAEVDADSGTLILSGADNASQATIEALPPQVDVQLAADELRNVMQELDENMLQITEYIRHEFWSDAYIYRAYSGEDRITAMIKSVHGIPLRITVSEPADVQELNKFMAMISSVGTDEIERLTEADDTFAEKLVDRVYQLQAELVERHGAEPEASGEAADAANNSLQTEISSLSLPDLADSREDIIAYLETVYTPDAAAQAADGLGLAFRDGMLLAEPAKTGSQLLWDQASFTLISESEQHKRYLLRVPVEESGTYKLQEIELRKTETGWRSHTPLDMRTKLPGKDSEQQENEVVK